MQKQVAQLSPRDRAAGWVSFGQKWTTIFCRGKTEGNHLTMFYVFYPHNIYVIQFVSVRGIH